MARQLLHIFFLGSCATVMDSWRKDRESKNVREEAPVDVLGKRCKSTLPKAPGAKKKKIAVKPPLDYVSK